MGNLNMGLGKIADSLGMTTSEEKLAAVRNLELARLLRHAPRYHEILAYQL